MTKHLGPIQPLICLPIPVDYVAYTGNSGVHATMHNSWKIPALNHDCGVKACYEAAPGIDGIFRSRGQTLSPLFLGTGRGAQREISNITVITAAHW